MTRVIMHGCNGHMGVVISEIAANDPDVEIVAGVDINTEEKFGYPVFANINDCNVEADAIIDFSVVAAMDALLAYSKAKNIPVVLCTTGLSEDDMAKVKETSKDVAVLKSANMSLGINTVMKLLKLATEVLADRGYDIEIVEKHHNQKVDAPSGTALALADVINETKDNRYEYVYDRSQKREKRSENEIGLSAVRGGTIVGQHDVIYAGIDEVIEIHHTAYSKAVFGKGAIDAAKFIAGKGPGMYDMSDVIG